jgi:hypothetical protein
MGLMQSMVPYSSGAGIQGKLEECWQKI